MPPISTYLIALCLGLYGLILVVELIRFRRLRAFSVQLAALVTVAALLHLTTGFPTPSSWHAFGGVGPLGAIGLMFLFVLLGMAARYLFYLRGKFSWLSFLKPLCASPIVLLPLLGALQGLSQIEPIQLVSFCFLAFQNGFFWKVVFERAKAQA